MKTTCLKGFVLLTNIDFSKMFYVSNYKGNKRQRCCCPLAGNMPKKNLSLTYNNFIFARKLIYNGN